MSRIKIFKITIIAILVAMPVCLSLILYFSAGRGIRLPEWVWYAYILVAPLTIYSLASRHIAGDKHTKSVTPTRKPHTILSIGLALLAFAATVLLTGSMADALIDPPHGSSALNQISNQIVFAGLLCMAVIHIGWAVHVSHLFSLPYALQNLSFTFAGASLAVCSNLFNWFSLELSAEDAARVIYQQSAWRIAWGLICFVAVSVGVRVYRKNQRLTA